MSSGIFLLVILAFEGQLVWSFALFISGENAGSPLLEKIIAVTQPGLPANATLVYLSTASLCIWT